jgi:hypothetical protein
VLVSRPTGHEQSQVAVAAIGATACSGAGGGFAAQKRAQLYSAAGEGTAVQTTVALLTGSKLGAKKGQAIRATPQSSAYSSNISTAANKARSHIQMLRKTMVALAVAVAVGGSALSTSAFAFDSAFGGGHRASSGYASQSDGVGNFHRGLRQSDGRRDKGDPWGHWGTYYGPMIH